jgi:hypothetical protein
MEPNQRYYVFALNALNWKGKAYLPIPSVTVIMRQIRLASCAMDMLQSAAVRLEQSDRDSSVARHYLRETGLVLELLQGELQASRGHQGRLVG